MQIIRLIERMAMETILAVIVRECVANGWPANCRWATRAEQRRNQKDVRFLESRGALDCV